MWDKKKGGSGSGKDAPKPRDPKETRKFLDNHPARQSGMPRNVDRVGFETGGAVGDISADEREAALSRQILVYHESQNAETGNDWMYKLKEDSMQYLAEKRGIDLQQIYRESIYKKGIETLIDKIYGLLQRYQFEFNQVAAGTELHVSGTISGDVTEVTRANKLREAQETKTYFRARLSTRTHSLVLRGKDDAIEFYLLPVNKVMALSKSEVDYKPLARIQVKISELGMMWRMSDANPSVDSLDELCMWLFSSLIQATKSAAVQDDSSATG
ncbi:MAG: hypothetical protein U0103_21465 [Candidatus Obscuribacterales bacterium]|nr:hypothetical protein [Cyanobacteria bacterium SZAS LIN-5]RTL43842.1 MAG: hypothetical protein EKK48_08855 [Candidatus Melainabacteria bacterium]